MSSFESNINDCESDKQLAEFMLKVTSKCQASQIFIGSQHQIRNENIFYQIYRSSKLHEIEKRSANREYLSAEVGGDEKMHSMILQYKQEVEKRIPCFGEK